MRRLVSAELTKKQLKRFNAKIAVFAIFFLYLHHERQITTICHRLASFMVFTFG